MKADADERGEFFANMAAEGNEDLLGELDDLMDADEEEKVFNEMN